MAGEAAVGATDKEALARRASMLAAATLAWRAALMVGGKGECEANRTEPHSVSCTREDDFKNVSAAWLYGARSGRAHEIGSAEEEV